MLPDEHARELGCSWAQAGDRQLQLARTAFDRSMWNEAVALSAAAVERYLKAVLVARSTPFQYTHNIDRLFTRQADDIRQALAEVLTARLRQQLTDGGTVARYPGGPSYTRGECQSAVEAATAVRRVLGSAEPGLFSGDAPGDGETH
jgi:HEPN domain-containing protein